ncbi:flavocytochrome c [uncultured Pseudoflavonifractor sp.]|uniref:flavocytochrome c n=1 Tax=uncultured Pseudoflavonifractor sp. TaxID=1221379 RepID=UPI0025E79384|nr:flavocytochrome c [uncultured Pseudoflavonifractor sp.]
MIKKMSALFLAIALVFSLAACSNGTADNSAQPSGSQTVTEGKFTPGTYEGEGQGMESTIKVAVTLSADRIEKIEVLESDETPAIGETALESLPQAVVDAQSTQIDSISGATITSQGFFDAVNAALTAAGVDPASLTPVSGGSDQTGEEQTLDVDVVVVGAGGAGMTAAITAAQAGKSVVILEKTSMVGGNSVRSTGGMNAAKTEWQDANEFTEDAGVEKTLATAAETYPDLADLVATVQAQYDAYKANPTGYFDSVELFILDTMVGGQDINNYDLVKTLAENSAPAIEWLSTIGADLHNVGSFGGASVKRIHRPVDADGKVVSVGSYVVPILQQACEDNGVQIIYNAPATEILMDNGAAVGVKADGYTVNAKSVVLATGGFGANLDMVAELKPELKGFVTTNAPGITGDGIKMAEAVGAATVDMDQIQIHPTVEQKTSALITEGLRGDGAILVNAEGLRFCDEVGTRDAVSAAELAQTGGYAWLVVDQKMVDASSVIAGYIKAGYTVQGDTYEALAEAMGVPADAFASTMEKWNAAVAAGTDAEFGRTSFANPLDTAPYYAIKIAPGVHHTMGGVKINTSAQVLDTEDNVIPGLFAAGEVTGGIHGANRLGGNAVADFIVFGRISGQSAADYAK